MSEKDKDKDKHKFDMSPLIQMCDKDEFTFNANDSYLNIFYSFFMNKGMLLRLSILIILFLSFIF